MKTSRAITIALVAVGAFSGSAWGNPFTWQVNGTPGSWSYTSGSSWTSGPGNSPFLSLVSSSTKSGTCPGCVISFTLPISFNNVLNEWDVTGGTFTISTPGTLTVGASTFTGTLLTGTLSSFIINRIGANYVDYFGGQPTVSITSFASGLLAAFGLPSMLATGTLDLSWMSSGVQSGQSFSGTFTGGSLDLSVSPESATWLLLGSGLIVLGVLRRARRVKT
jgi:hypothetical protein